MPLLLIEIYGFHGTLRIGTLLNGLLFVSAVGLSLRSSAGRRSVVARTSRGSCLQSAARPAHVGNKPLMLLFLTGLSSMGAEVVWIRQFTPYLSTVVYAFASILGVYLAATFAGSRVYRFWSRTHDHEGGLVWGVLGFVSLAASAYRQSLFSGAEFLAALLRLVLGIAPFSAILGFVTPMLVDRWSGGDPEQGGQGICGQRGGMHSRAAGRRIHPVAIDQRTLGAVRVRAAVVDDRPGAAMVRRCPKGQAAQTLQRKLSYALAALAVVGVLTIKGFEDLFVPSQVLRDNTATVIATGDGMTKRLLVNGIGITFLTPITKMMAHLPLAFLDHAPRSALVVCFGMGTTYRSLLSWDIQTTAVELVPSVPRLFSYFHSDGAELMKIAAVPRGD